MEARIFQDIFSTPDMNWERWMNKRALDKKFTWEDMWNKRKRYDQHRNLKLNHRRRKETKNNKLEAPLVSSWESPDKNIDGKEWRNFPSIKWILEEEILVLEEKQKGGRVGKTKATWRRMKQTPLRRSDKWSCKCWRERIHLRRDTPVKKKDWQDRLDDQEGLVFT